MSVEGFSESIVWAVLGVGAGIYMFFTGFRELKHSRTIQNIPTCKIATGAVGTNVEVKGQILRDENKLLKAPISGRECSFYSVEIQRLVKRKNSNHWVKVDQFFSDEGFLLDDESGANAMVYVKGAMFKRKGGLKTFQSSSNHFSSLPPGLSTALKENEKKLKSFKMKETSWLGSSEYRFLEWAFVPGETLYVLGFADSGLGVSKRKKLKFKTFLEAKKQIRSNEEQHARFDKNQDGVLDPEELEHGAKILGEQLELSEGKPQVEELMTKTKMIFKNKPSYPFIISNMQETDLIKRMSFTATMKVWGGPVVTIASVAYLAFRFLSIQ